MYLISYSFFSLSFGSFLSLFFLIFVYINLTNPFFNDFAQKSQKLF